MLFQPTHEPPNPHAPFVYRDGEIRHVGDLGDRYEADVWESRSGWRWSARFAACAMDTEPLWNAAPTSEPVASEAVAVSEAVAWLRARCVALHGGCG